MTALIILGSLACLVWLMSLILYVIQRLMGDYNKSMDVYLFQMYSFVIFAICIILAYMIKNY